MLVVMWCQVQPVSPVADHAFSRIILREEIVQRSKVSISISCELRISAITATKMPPVMQHFWVGHTIIDLYVYYINNICTVML